MEPQSAGHPTAGVPNGDDGDNNHAALREDTLVSEQAYRGAFLDVRRDQVRLPDGSTAQREYIVHPAR